MDTRQLLLDKAKWIYGWMLLEELSFLAEISSNLPENSIVFEIGSFCGKSARAIADNSPNNCKIYCIDPWDFQIPLYDIYGNVTEIMLIDKGTYQQFRSNLKDHIESYKVIPIEMKWEDFHSRQKADFVFIDGNHTYEAVKHDILKAMMYIKSNGIIAGHDYTNFEGVHRAVNECFDPREIQVRETIWFVRKF